MWCEGESFYIGIDSFSQVFNSAVSLIVPISSTSSPVLNTGVLRLCLVMEYVGDDNRDNFVLYIRVCHKFIGGLLALCIEIAYMNIQHV